MPEISRTELSRRSFLQLSCASLAACGLHLALNRPARAEVADPESAEPDLFYMEGFTEAVKEPDVQQYARTGALPFWVAGMFAGSWLHNLNFNTLPPDLIKYYQNAGNTYRNLVGAQSIWETIPRSVRIGGPEALREFRASRDWSHFVPRSLGGSDSANAGIFEKKLLNQIRGAAPMTAEEIARARFALNTAAVRQGLFLTARVVLVGALAALVVEITLTLLEYGLQYHEGKITQADLYSQVGQHLLQSTGIAIVASGLISGLTIVFPPLLPIIGALALPMAFASFALIGYRFYTLNTEWMQRVGLAPLQEAWNESKAIPNQVWGEAATTLAEFRVQLGDASGWVLQEASDISKWVLEGVGDASEWALQGVGDLSEDAWQGVGGTSRSVIQGTRGISIRTWQGAGGLSDDALEGIGDFSERSLHGVGDFSERALQGAGELSHGALESLEEFPGGAWDTAGDSSDKALQKAQEILEDAEEILRNVWPFGE